jgi:hypothetical protein
MHRSRTKPNPRKSNITHERVGALMAEFGFYRSPAEADRSPAFEPVDRQQPEPVPLWPVGEKDRQRLSVPLLMG